MDIKELFDIIYNKYKNNDDVIDYGIFDNKSCLSIGCMTEYNYGRIEIDLDVNIGEDNIIDLFVKDEYMDGYFRICNIENTDIIFNTIDFILNNYSIEGLKKLGFK